MSKDEFFSEWEDAMLKTLTLNMREYIYSKYVLKCIVFQRDNFTCKNEGCNSQEALTLHHIKFKKNDGKDTPRNAATICKPCHMKFHRGKDSLTFDGATYQIHQNTVQTMSPLEMKKQGRKFRKTIKEYHGYKISWELLQILMRFLEKDYTEIYMETGEDDD